MTSHSASLPRRTGLRPWGTATSQVLCVSLLMMTKRTAVSGSPVLLLFLFLLLRLLLLLGRRWWGVRGGAGAVQLQAEDALGAPAAQGLLQGAGGRRQGRRRGDGDDPLPRPLVARHPAGQAGVG